MLGELERDEELAAALWSVMIPRVARCSAKFDELETRLRRHVVPPTPAELRAAAEETEALGWLLGCVAEGLDGKLFTDRRSARGLRWMLELLGEACTQRGRRLVVHAPAVGPGEEPTRSQLWACAEVLWLASGCRVGALECRLERRAEAWHLSCQGPLEPRVARRALLWSGSAPRVVATGWSWSVGCAGAGSSAE